MASSAYALTVCNWPALIASCQVFFRARAPQRQTNDIMIWLLLDSKLKDTESIRNSTSASLAYDAGTFPSAGGLMLHAKGRQPKAKSHKRNVFSKLPWKNQFAKSPSYTSVHACVCPDASDQGVFTGHVRIYGFCRIYGSYRVELTLDF